MNKNLKGKNIGKGATILMKFNENTAMIHEDVDVMGAPSECHALVSRGDQYRFRLVRRHIKSVTGLKFKEFQKELDRRTSARWVYFHNLVPAVHEGKIRVW